MSDVAFRILVCGSRTYTDRRQLTLILNGIVAPFVAQNKPVIIVQGEADGADLMAKRWAEFAPDNITTEDYPADWDTYGKRAGYLRNIQMLESGVNLVVAFLDVEMTTGTGHTVREAKAMGLPVWEVYSNLSDRKVEQ